MGWVLSGSVWPDDAFGPSAMQLTAGFCGGRVKTRSDALVERIEWDGLVPECLTTRSKFYSQSGNWTKGQTSMSHASGSCRDESHGETGSKGRRIQVQKSALRARSMR